MGVFEGYGEDDPESEQPIAQRDKAAERQEQRLRDDLNLGLPFDGDPSPNGGKQGSMDAETWYDNRCGDCGAEVYYSDSECLNCGIPFPSTPSPNGVKAPGMNAEQLFEQALTKVESSTIRIWANSERNRPLWIKMAEAAIVKHNGEPDVSIFAALIVAQAIGL
jgi:hypothetical protein